MVAVSEAQSSLLKFSVLEQGKIHDSNSRNVSSVMGAPLPFSSLGVQLTSYATNVRFQCLDKADTLLTVWCGSQHRNAVWEEETLTFRNRIFRKLNMQQLSVHVKDG